ncbi:hypothetical protein [Acidovorax sp. NCPPB 3576]|uniref:hypothetical protein n=1 Tax=Acidovorax sp. NCPPB 3576 TaxID=2940488 RepID=UPI0023497365|nr:hypothetical protein [Acidovorax sp. NCPPB 3576]WCM86529.1 hypothetical protein M5C98_14175 [Acidovorax sp. NCPPB 3576]
MSSKSAILEVCGWLEQAMDCIVMETALRCAISTKRQEKISASYIKPTSGFSYKQHFEKMIISVVGYRILEQAEIAVGPPIFLMESSLDYLVKLRNHYAHTHFDIANPYPKGLSTIPSPTVMRTHANTAFNGLNLMEIELKACGC